MARPRKFDETAALDAAIACFWSRGYETTSIRDLAAAMGMTGASLYNAFGDKHALFRRALDRYLDIRVRPMPAYFEQSAAPLQAIFGLLNEIISRSVDDPERRGCFLINTALETAPHDPVLRDIVDCALAEIEGFFKRCIQRGRQDGTIAAGPAPDELAAMLLGLMVGIRVLSRTRPNREILQGMIAPLNGILSAERITP